MNNKFQTDSAAELMVGNVPIIEENSKIGEVEELLVKKAKGLESINYIYIVDGKGKLKGVASVKDVFQSSKNTRISDVMEKKIVSVHPRTDQERVAILALKNSLKAVPVVDKDGIFLGVITSDIILNTLHKEHVEDFLRSAGIHHKSSKLTLDDLPLGSYFKKRLPWLIVGLAGGLLAAFVVEFFEMVLREEIILAAFIPVIVYMADAVGVQAQTVFIRALALNEKLKIKKYFLREMKATLLLALFLGITLSIISLLWLNLPLIALTLALSMFATVVVASIIAVTLPLVFLKSRFDPAIASGPFATTIRDILSLIIYFFIAYLVIF